MGVWQASLRGCSPYPSLSPTPLSLGASLTRISNSSPTQLQVECLFWDLGDKGKGLYNKQPPLPPECLVISQGSYIGAATRQGLLKELFPSWIHLGWLSGNCRRRKPTHPLLKPLFFPLPCTFPRFSSSFLFLPATQLLNNPHQHNVLVIVQWGWHLDSQSWKKSHGFGYARMLNLTNPKGPGGWGVGKEKWGGRFHPGTGPAKCRCWPIPGLPFPAQQE